MSYLIRNISVLGGLLICVILITDLDIHHDIIVKRMVRTLFYSKGILNNSVVITPEPIVMITLGTD